MKVAKPLQDSDGLTFLELIATLLIIAIIGSVAASRTLSAQGLQASAELDQVRSHLRFAQRKSISTNASWGIHYSSASEYRLFRESTVNTRKLPGEESPSVALGALRITNAPVTVTFDTLGSPGASPVTIVTSKGAVVVEGGTGFVE
jgi:Tfp pilus assembly protein FimT